MPAGPGKRWLPGWLGRVLPYVAVESAEDAAFEDAEIDDIPDEAAPAVT